MATWTKIITLVRVGVRMRMMEMVVEEEGDWQAGLISATPTPSPERDAGGISPRSRAAGLQRCARWLRSAVEGGRLRRAGGRAGEAKGGTQAGRLGQLRRRRRRGRADGQDTTRRGLVHRNLEFPLCPILPTIIVFVLITPSHPSRK